MGYIDLTRAKWSVMGVNGLHDLTGGMFKYYVSIYIPLLNIQRVAGRVVKNSIVKAYDRIRFTAVFCTT